MRPELMGDDWYEFMKPFLESNDFKKISATLLRLSEEGKVITPSFSNTFRAFKECRYKDLAVVMLGQDPYPGLNPDGTFIADGLAFSARNSKKCPASLDLIYRAIWEDIYSEWEVPAPLFESLDLTKWANQGVLLLNTALTYQRGEDSGCHFDLWKPFMTFFFEKLILSVREKHTISFIHFGKMAQTYMPITKRSKMNQVLACSHPASAKYTGGRWNHETVFKACDAFQHFLNTKNIRW